MLRRVAVVAAAVIGLVILGWLLVRRLPPPTTTPTEVPAVPTVVTRVVTQFVVDSAQWVRQRDSLVRVIRRLRTDSAAARQALDSAAQAIDALPPDATASDTVRVLDRGWAACRLALGNCEERAQSYEARAAVAEAQVHRVNKRATCVAIGAAAIGGAAVLGADRTVVLSTAALAAVAVLRC